MSKGKRMKTEETASIRRNKNKTAKLNFFKLVAFIYVVITIILYFNIENEHVTRMGNCYVYYCRDNIYICNGSRINKKT